jgi:prephenate dehydrogenase
MWRDISLANRDALLGELDAYLAQLTHLRARLAASGFRVFTRIAASSPEMWRDICLAIRDALLGELDAYLAQLAGLRTMLAAADGAAIEGVYANARRARRQWTGEIESAETPPPRTAE